MLIVPGDARKIRELGHPVDERRNRVAKVLPELVQRDRRVLHGVMQDARREHLRRNTQLGQYLCHCKAVVDVWFAGDALLTAMCLLGHRVGALHQLPVCRRVRRGQLLE